MPRHLPKAIEDSKWKLFTGQRVYAMRSHSDDFIVLRLGMGKAFYLEIAPLNNDSRVLNSIDYETGAVDLLMKLQEGLPLAIGRASPCTVKILHPYVSRQHIELTIQGDILLVKDLGSVNGSYYNTNNFCFDVDKYLDSHPVKLSKDGTLDALHEAFGPTLDDFLKLYSEKKESKP